MKKENFTPQELFLYAIGVNERTKEPVGGIKWSKDYA